MIAPILFLLLLVASCSFAFRRGGRAERAGACIILIGAVLTPLVQGARVERWHHAETGVLVVDTSMLLAFLILMFRTNRFWPIWMSAFQLLTVAAHLGPVFRLADLAVPFALEEQIWAWVILVQLFIVTWLNRADRSPMRLPH